jgi:hypothetical protein
MILSILACLAASWALLALLRSNSPSLGLPFAYLGSLLLIHLPGAYAHLVSRQPLAGDSETAIGVRYTAIGAACFVIGVWLARRELAGSVLQATPPPATNIQSRFRLFCLVGGWLFVYGLAPLRKIPSLGATLDQGGALWLLGVMLGLRGALRERRIDRFLLWAGALAVYPVLMLLLGGFLSYGSTAVIIALAIVAVGARSQLRVLGGIAIAAVLGISLFTTYFEQRDAIRGAVWGGASMERRLDTVGGMLAGAHLFDANRADDVSALDQRLNQNFFIGLSAERIRDGEVPYLYGQSVWEGVLSLVPRIYWPDKPVFGGSPMIVSEMTGLHLSTSTSWGVGNVMEFYINFGVPGLVLGFGILGWLLGWLDLRAAQSELRGDFGRTILFFLPAAALIQPNGSLVELTGGAAAALVAALGWREAWRVWSFRRTAEFPSTISHEALRPTRRR